MSNGNKRTVAIDFDGVIHAYTKGWHDGTCYDVPMEGAQDAIRTLLKQYTVFILSTRDPRDIQHWMATHMPEFVTQIIPNDAEILFWNTEGVVGITQRKLPAIVYIDDRAEKFVTWSETLNSTWS